MHPKPLNNSVHWTKKTNASNLKKCVLTKFMYVDGFGWHPFSSVTQRSYLNDVIIICR